MARFFKSLILLSVMLLVSCQEGGEAGDLLGQWRLKGSDTNYLSFSGSVALFRDISFADTDLGKGQIYGNFQHIGDSLFIQCYSVKETASDTAVIENNFGFRPFSNIRVKIMTLDNDRLVLNQDSKTWSFEKY
ncbi:MAG: lipocalin-like domain-containing protein [Prevotella sp.]|nr:lipocalin-like domain-containing protein [Prevotella sp.]